MDLFIKYTDEDGELVALHSESDIKRGLQLGKLKIHCKEKSFLSASEFKTLDDMVDTVSI